MVSLLLSTKAKKQPAAIHRRILDRKPTRFRRGYVGLLLVVAWHSLFVSQPGQWHRENLQRNLNALVQSVELATWSYGLKVGKPVHCSNKTFCCGVWQVDADPWWTHHPDWEVISEDDNSFCFAPTPTETKRAFLREVHSLQWGVDITKGASADNSLALPETYNFAVNCTDMVASINIDSGFGASRAFLLWSFWFAYTRQKPFQSIEKWPWLYAKGNSTWLNCTTLDQTCFYLPISPCSREDKNWPRLYDYPDKNNSTQMAQSRWLEEYMNRPRQALRRKLLQLRRPLEQQLKGSSCLGMHVRRADVGTPQPPFRRYAAVMEYLDMVPNLEANTTIFLMTDDATTIEEVQQHYASKYRWVYSDKLRARGVELGFNMHVPNGSNGPDELAWLTVELDLLSSHCDSFVYGRSGVAYTAIELAKHKGRDMKLYALQTLVPSHYVEPFKGKPVEREAQLMNDITTRYEVKALFEQ